MVCLLNVGVIKWTVPQNRDKFKLKLILVSADINQPVAFCTLPDVVRGQIQNDTKKGNFWKTQQKLKKSNKKNLLAEIEPL